MIELTLICKFWIYIVSSHVQNHFFPTKFFFFFFFFALGGCKRKQNVLSWFLLQLWDRLKVLNSGARLVLPRVFLLEFSLSEPQYLLLGVGLQWIQVGGYWRRRMVNSSLILWYFKILEFFLMYFLLFNSQSFQIVALSILFRCYSYIQCDRKGKACHPLGMTTLRWICNIIYFYN